MKKKTKGSRSWSRILATQAMYKLSLNEDSDVSFIINNLLKKKRNKKYSRYKIFFKIIK